MFKTTHVRKLAKVTAFYVIAPNLKLLSWSQKLHPSQTTKSPTTSHFKQHLNTTGSPYFPYHTSLDIKSLYTFCGMNISLTTIRRQTHIFNTNISASAIQSLILFYLDNSYFEFNENFYSQDTEGTMGSPLVELAEISRTLPSPPAQVLPRFTDTLLTTGLENSGINLRHMDSSTSKANQLTTYNI